MAHDVRHPASPWSPWIDGYCDEVPLLPDEEALKYIAFMSPSFFGRIGEGVEVISVSGHGHNIGDDDHACTAVALFPMQWKPPASLHSWASDRRDFGQDRYWRRRNNCERSFMPVRRKFHGIPHSFSMVD